VDSRVGLRSLGPVAVIGALVLASACGGGAATPAAPAPTTPPAAASAPTQAWQVEWDQTLAAAKQEGKVVVSGPPGADQRQAIADGFQAAYPDIKIEYTPSRGTEIIAKVVQERQAGQYLWDAVIASVNPTLLSFKPINALAPLRDALILPELSQDATWFHGFQAGFTDDEQTYLYAPFGSATTAGYVNRDCLPESTFHSAQDLKSPALSDKLAWFDPSQPGTSSRTAWALSKEYGDSWVEDLLRHQKIVYSTDHRQMTDWLIACRVAVALGIVNDFILQAQAAGIGQSIQPIPMQMLFTSSAPGGAGGNTQIAWYTHAPHPNAARVFVNWYLSRDAQQAVATRTRANSRRLDTQPGDPPTALDPNVSYVNTNTEAATREIQAFQDRLPGWMGR
jgi:iron(III) transport system substrate-binding protein